MEEFKSFLKGSLGMLFISFRGVTTSNSEFSKAGEDLGCVARMVSLRASMVCESSWHTKLYPCLRDSESRPDGVTPATVEAIRRGLRSSVGAILAAGTDRIATVP